MKRLSSLMILLLFVCSSCTNSVKIVITNPTEITREGEIVEIDCARLSGAESYIVRCAESGAEIPSQLTYDDKLIFQCFVAANGSTEYLIEAGEPCEYEPLVFGKQYPERVDDFAWESDCMAYRLYGPALQASGERAYGYDVWVKNTSDLVVDERYRLEKEEGVSYHVDHGNGLDCYKVGPTLGAGAPALMVEDQIIYPYCYRSYEVLDNGPLRLTFALEYNPFTVGEDRDVVERRIISIDAGSYLNKSYVTYSNLSQPTTLVTGLVMQDEEGVADYSANLQDGYSSYATDCGKDGIIYVSIIYPQETYATQARYFDKVESETLRGRAKGHILNISNYNPGSTYSYYWGAGWSKGRFKSHEEWKLFLKEYVAKVETPLVVEIE